MSAEVKQEMQQMRREIPVLRKQLDETISKLIGDTSSYDEHKLSEAVSALRRVNEEAAVQLLWVEEGIA